MRLPRPIAAAAQARVSAEGRRCLNPPSLQSPSVMSASLFVPPGLDLDAALADELLVVLALVERVGLDLVDCRVTLLCSMRSTSRSGCTRMTCRSWVAAGWPPPGWDRARQTTPPPGTPLGRTRPDTRPSRWTATL